MRTEPATQCIELWSIDRLVEYSRNPRKNDAAVDRMCASIREFGFKIPCLVRSAGEVVDGHLRLKAARKLEIAEIPVILYDEWTRRSGIRPRPSSSWVVLTKTSSTTRHRNLSSSCGGRFSTTPGAGNWFTSRSWVPPPRLPQPT